MNIKFGLAEKSQFGKYLTQKFRTRLFTLRNSFLHTCAKHVSFQSHWFDVAFVVPPKGKILRVKTNVHCFRETEITIIKKLI